MRILYHHRTLGDGAEGIHVSSLVEAFLGLNYEVKMAALIGQQTNVSTPRTQVLERLTRRMPRPLYEVMEMGYNLVGYRLLQQYIKKWQPDFLYERYILFNFAGLMAARRSGIPIILEVNSPLAYERATYERLSLRRLARLAERFVCSRVDLVVTVSTPLKDYLVQQGVAAERIVVLPNGVEPEIFRPDAQARAEIRARLHFAPATVVIGFAGILRPWHGIELLIEAAAKMEAGPEKVHVLIVGDGPSRAGLEELVQSCGLQNMVTFTGRVPHAEVPRYLAAFDIGVSPHATFYASPMKIPEYMATGMAVLAPRMPNLQDLIAEGLNGMLFRPEDVHDLARTLKALVDDSDQRQRLGQQARATVRTWQQNALRILALVDKEQSPKA